MTKMPLLHANRNHPDERKPLVTAADKGVLLIMVVVITPVVIVATLIVGLAG